LKQTIPVFFRSISGAELFFVSVLLTAGLYICFTLPADAGFDEGTHLLRVWEMSAFHFVPNDGTKMPFPAIFLDISYRENPVVDIVEPGFWSKYAGLPMDAHDYIYQDYLLKTSSVYSPPLLLPQALVMRYFGRAWKLPALTIYYACRIVGLLSYLLLVWIALRLIPSYGKWILAILAVTPMAILQASTINADSITNGIGLLFIGGCLAMAERNSLGWKEFIVLLFLIFLVFLSKQNVVFLALLPFFIIPPSRFKIRRGHAFLVAAAIILFIVEVVGWNLIAYSKSSGAMTGSNLIGQMKNVFFHPFIFFVTILSDVWRHGGNYVRGWIGVYEYSYWSVPALTYVLFLLAIFFGVFLKSDRGEPSQRTRFGLVTVFIVSYLATFTLFYVFFNPVGSPNIIGVQGRYFLPIIPLLFLAIPGIPWLSHFRPPVWIALIATVASIVFYGAGIYLSYHVLCGDSYYLPGLCYLPKYKNWGPNDFYSQPVSDQLTLTQNFIPKCNGMETLRIWVNSSGADPESVTKVILQDSTSKIDSQEFSIPDNQLPEGNWYTLNFDPDWESAGKLYTLTIRSGDIAGHQGVRVATTQEAKYMLGELFINQVLNDQGIIYQYGCIAGLEKIWLTGHP
jgi:uncharacterized membrane protein